MLHRKTLAEMAKELKAKKVSSEELTRTFLERIERHNPRLNAFITVLKEQALAGARTAEKRLAAGQGGPLTGLPIAHKDIFCTAGVKTTCASRMLENFVAPYDATVVARLKQAGTVLLGKTNMDEFAM
ncbi:MAG TPA: amidase, partial [Gammaproteobacteria bacterium]|nr:amidase [Gammaproteobacteria bacterium]